MTSLMTSSMTSLVTMKSAGELVTCGRRVVSSGSSTSVTVAMTTDDGELIGRLVSNDVKSGIEIDVIVVENSSDRKVSSTSGEKSGVCKEGVAEDTACVWKSSDDCDDAISAISVVKTSSSAAVVSKTISLSPEPNTSVMSPTLESGGKLSMASDISETEL